MNLTIDDIARACNTKRQNAMTFYDPLIESMGQFNIDNEYRRAAFLATVAVESDNLTAVEESLYYRDELRLCAIYPRIFHNAASATKYVRNPAALSELLYQGYHGRGLIQLTHKDNYARASIALGFNYIDHPELVLEPKHAALTAGWYWSENACNQAADRKDMRDVTRRVNGPALMKLKERTQLFEDNVKWMLT